MSDFERATETMVGIFQLAQERDRLRELLREAEQAIECESTGYSCLRARIREALGE